MTSTCIEKGSLTTKEVGAFSTVPYFLEIFRTWQDLLGVYRSSGWESKDSGIRILASFILSEMWWIIYLGIAKQNANEVIFFFFTIIYGHSFKCKISKLIFQFFFVTFNCYPKVLLCVLAMDANICEVKLVLYQLEREQRRTLDGEFTSAASLSPSVYFSGLIRNWGWFSSS